MPAKVGGALHGPGAVAKVDVSAGINVVSNLLFIHFSKYSPIPECNRILILALERRIVDAQPNRSNDINLGPKDDFMVDPVLPNVGA